MTLISAEIEPVDGKETEAARDLRRRGFRILRRDATLSVDAPAALWTDVFGVRFEAQRRPSPPGMPQPAETWLRPKQGAIRIPAALRRLIKSVRFIEPPEFF